MKTALTLSVLFTLAMPSIRGAESEAALRFFEEKVQRDADDIIAQNQLAERYLAQLRRTGRLEWIPKARASADASLRSLSGPLNPAGQLASARVALAEHRFTEAARLALAYTAQRPRSAAGWETLFDAQFELGEYAASDKALKELIAAGGDEISIAARQSMWALVHGGDAATPLEASLSAARKMKQPVAEVLVWSLLKRGELAFNSGDFAAAGKYYDEATSLAPDDWRVQIHVAELRGAEGRLDEALVLLEKSIASTGRAELLQAAGDLEAARGKPDAAKPWHDRALAAYLASIERGEALYIHHLAGFYCDSRPQPAEAVKFARKDLADRASIHAHAALAWALHLDNQLEAAAAESALALATGTKDAHILYQAGLIFTAAGDLPRGRAAMRAAVEANPRRASFHFHR